MKRMPEMVKTEGSHGGEREKKTRQRASTSCTECKRRKQKVDWMILDERANG
jgi:hypothetical protein